eukprot:TRINITY_DN95818_c0_g1_i1.p2 TRINITY_DN95818_c0_g1~~TRINITY_DN95818_c0_g1_i1.p2  ORF type:complete len:187 (-),score=35.17 TRINITY_DN95818_c0_g1_i1:264-773(-)
MAEEEEVDDLPDVLDSLFPQYRTKEKLDYSGSVDGFMVLQNIVTMTDTIAPKTEYETEFVFPPSKKQVSGRPPHHMLFRAWGHAMKARHCSYELTITCKTGDGRIFMLMCMPGGDTTVHREDLEDIVEYAKNKLGYEKATSQTIVDILDVLMKNYTMTIPYLPEVLRRA